MLWLCTAAALATLAAAAPKRPLSVAEVMLLRADIGHSTFESSIQDPTARRLFSAGVQYSWGFGFADATLAFSAAHAREPANPMPPWGVAFASSRNLNAAQVTMLVLLLVLLVLLLMLTRSPLQSAASLKVAHVAVQAAALLAAAPCPPGTDKARWARQAALIGALQQRCGRSDGKVRAMLVVLLLLLLLLLLMLLLLLLLLLLLRLLLLMLLLLLLLQLLLLFALTDVSDGGQGAAAARGGRDLERSKPPRGLAPHRIRAAEQSAGEGGGGAAAAAAAAVAVASSCC